VKLPREAALILAEREIKPSERWAEVWEVEQGRAFTAAHLARADQLLDIHKALVKSLDGGATKAQFVAGLGSLLEKKGWKSKDGDDDVPFRLARIYDINRRAARAAGQWDRIERTKEILPYLLYISGPCEGTMPTWQGSACPWTTGGGTRTSRPTGRNAIALCFRYHALIVTEWRRRGRSRTRLRPSGRSAGLTLRSAMR